jgi:hypothetical protein
MKRLSLALVPLVLAGCPVTQLNRLPESSRLPQPKPIAIVDDFKHAPSGYIFPAEVEAFRRVAILQYDTAGLDVSAGYNASLPECPIVLTIYIYPTPRMSFIGADPDLVRSLEGGWLDHEYSVVKRQIVTAHTDAILKSEDSKVQDEVPGKKAVYAIANAESELYLFVVRHSWFLEYRVTYPSLCAERAQQSLGSFYTAWTTVANRSRSP